jgi:5-methylthioadenosine/S-adenosylhomocysteine deaminase
MSDLLIRGCTVVHIDSPQQARVVPAQDIAIAGNRIRAVLPTGQANPARFAQVVEAQGLVAMPGLINCHAHVPMVLFRGLAEDVSIDRWFNEYIWPLENNLTPGDVFAGELLGAAEMIRAGVTSVADHYFHMDDAARAVEQSGMRALLGWAIFTSSGEAMIERTADFVSNWHGAANGRIRACMAPHANYTCSDDYLRAVAYRARQLGVSIHIHAAETMSQTEASLAKTGLTPIQTLEMTGILDSPTIIAHGCGLLPEDIDILARYEAGVAHAPKTYLKLAMDVTPILAAREAGVPIGLATDGACSNNTMNLWESLRLMAMMQKDRAGSPEVLPIPEALYIATRESARVFGLENELGALEPGYLADIILLDLGGLHHQPLYSVTASLVYNVEPPDVHTVLIDGEVVMHNRKIHTVDVPAVIAQTQASRARLSQRNVDQRIQTYNP